MQWNRKLSTISFIEHEITYLHWLFTFILAWTLYSHHCCSACFIFILLIPSCAFIMTDFKFQFCLVLASLCGWKHLLGHSTKSVESNLRCSSNTHVNSGIWFLFTLISSFQVMWRPIDTLSEREERVIGPCTRPYCT